MSDMNGIGITEFQQVQGIISLPRSKALQTVNNENLLAAWEIGAFVSSRLKNATWGSKTVMQLSEYLRVQDPGLRGYSRRNIYNMVAFYEAYSSVQFIEYQYKLKLDEFVQAKTAQIENSQITQPKIPQIESEQIVQFQTAQFPNFLNLTSLTNHFEIINACKNIKEVLQRSLEEFTHFLNPKK